MESMEAPLMGASFFVCLSGKECWETCRQDMKKGNGSKQYKTKDYLASGAWAIWTNGTYTEKFCHNDSSNL